MAHDEYIGVTLAVCSSIAVGTSYVTTKVGLKDASQRHGFNGDGHEYFRNPIWWTGMVMLVLGEIFNFAAYAFAPAILVTPLGALSVLTGTILGAYFLGERLSVIGRLGCALCLIGSVLIVANAPPDQEIETVNEILQFAVQPGFLFFCFVTAVFTVVMIYFVCPKYGTVNPVFYLSICASTGAVSVMALKAFGIAIKLTFAGENQFIHLSTYFFATVAIGCIVVQMNYFNKALSTFSQSLVSPIYYVTFTTAVLTASFVLFQGFNVSDGIKTTSLLSGFITIFTGVYLLSLPNSVASSRKIPGNVLTDELTTNGTEYSRATSSESTRPAEPGSREARTRVSGTNGRNDEGYPLRGLARHSEYIADESD